MQKWIAVLLSLIALLMAAVLVLTAAVFHLYGGKRHRRRGCGPLRPGPA